MRKVSEFFMAKGFKGYNQVIVVFNLDSLLKASLFGYKKSNRIFRRVHDRLFLLAGAR